MTKTIIDQANRYLQLWFAHKYGMTTAQALENEFHRDEYQHIISAYVDGFIDCFWQDNG